VAVALSRGRLVFQHLNAFFLCAVIPSSIPKIAVGRKGKFLRIRLHNAAEPLILGQ